MNAISPDYLAVFRPYMQDAPVDVAACAHAVGLPIYSTQLGPGISGMIKRENGGFVC
jgi:hypothetical protein